MSNNNLDIILTLLAVAGVYTALRKVNEAAAQAPVAGGGGTWVNSGTDLEGVPDGYQLYNAFSAPDFSFDPWAETPTTPTTTSGGSTPQFSTSGASDVRTMGAARIAAQLKADLRYDFGLTNLQAAAIIGNLAKETDNFRALQEYKPMVAGSRGGWGIAQWTGPRRVNMENWSRANGLALESYAANYGFLKHELSGEYRGIVNNLKNINDLQWAVDYFCGISGERYGFLMPHGPTRNLAGRVAFARQYL